LTEKEKKVEKEKKEKKSLNIVQEKTKKSKPKAPALDPAEERAIKELNKVAAYQARMTKRNNRQKKIRTVIEENEKPQRTGKLNLN
jgi:ATP-dependent RNA helicase DDX27